MLSTSAQPPSNTPESLRPLSNWGKISKTIVPCFLNQQEMIQSGGLYRLHPNPQLLWYYTTYMCLDHRGWRFVKDSEMPSVGYANAIFNQALINAHSIDLSDIVIKPHSNYALISMSGNASVPVQAAITTLKFYRMLASVGLSVTLRPIDYYLVWGAYGDTCVVSTHSTTAVAAALQQGLTSDNEDALLKATVLLGSESCPANVVDFYDEGINYKAKH